MRFWRIFVCTWAVSGAISAAEVVVEQSSAESIERAILVPKAQFQESELVRLSREYLARHTERKAVKLFMATDEGAVKWAFQSAGERHYIHFVLRYFEPGWRSWGMAEAIRLGPNAVLRIRYPDGKLGRLVLQGTDPLRPVGGAGRFEVLYVSFAPPEEPKMPPIPAVFFVMTEEPLSPAVCERIAGELKASTGLVRADVATRNDHWFITSPKMPVRYEFWPTAQILGPVEFVERPTGYSGWNSDGSLGRAFVMYPTRPPKYCPVSLAGPDEARTPERPRE